MVESATSELHVPSNPIRVVTAASLFDGHDAAINIMRRILQRQGAEVIHLGHDRSVDDVVSAAVEEDAHAVAISSYQGGHVEYFTYLVDLLRERGAGHVRVYGGGGGVIVQREIDQLHAHGVSRIFSPQDGQTMGLPGMINTIIRECDEDLAAQPPASVGGAVHRRARGRGPRGDDGRVRDAARRGARAGRRRERRAPRAGPRHHRHRRLREVQPHRRARPARPHGPRGQAADRGARGGPDPPSGWWRPARRPHPHERPRRADHVPLDGQPQLGHRAARAPRRRPRRPAGRRDRPRRRGDPGHRSGRRGHRRRRRRLALRHDARVRRRVPAREDRHAGLRRRRRDQQVRAPRRGRRPARRRPPAAAQPRGVRLDVGGHAGLRDQRRDLPRRGRHRALREADLAARRARAGRAGGRRCRGPPRDPRHRGLHLPRLGDPRGARALPRRRRRHGARLPRRDRVDGRRGPPPLGAAPGARGPRRPRRGRAAGGPRGGRA